MIGDRADDDSGPVPDNRVGFLRVCNGTRTTGWIPRSIRRPEWRTP
jgi:hypothetical protein